MAMYFGGAARASRSSSEPESSSGRPSSRMRAVLSFASCTFGWSNGLIPSAQPATAVANSVTKKIRPRSAAPPITRPVVVGWPARLVGHGQDALAVLPGRLGEQLLDPQPEARYRLRDHVGQLVAAVLG